MPQTLTRLAAAIAPEDVQLYYQIALAGRRDLPMAPDPRVGFEMTLLRMLAFRPDTAAAGAGAAAAGAQPPRMPRPSIPAATLNSVAPPAPADSFTPSAPPRVSPGAPPRRVRRGTPPGVSPGASPGASPGVSPSRAAPSATGPGPAHSVRTIDAAGWPAVVDAAALSGMVRQFALNCVPASFERDVLSCSSIAAVDGAPARQIEEKLLQGLAKYLGRDIRIVFEVCEPGLATPARQRVAGGAGQGRCGQRRLSRRIRRSRGCASDSAPRSMPLR